MNTQTYIKEWQNFAGQWQGFETIVPPFLKSLDILIAKRQLDQAQKLIVATPNESFGEFPRYFLNIREAAIYEDKGNLEEAIKALESMQASGLDLLGAKVYFDLGRLYLKQGQREKARLSFEHVTSQMAQGEFVKMSQAYLSQLKGKGTSKVKVD